MTVQNILSRRFLMIGLGLFGLIFCASLVVAAVSGGYFYRRSRRVEVNISGAVYLLDVSERMTLPAVEGEDNRLVAARNVMAEMLRPSPSEITIGLRVFGSGAVPQACQDTDLLVPLAAGNQQRIIAQLATVTASETVEAPLAAAIVAAIRDLAAHSGPKTLVVITGGQDSCLAEAGRFIAQEAERAGIDLQTFVIGYQVTFAEAQAIKVMVVEAGTEAVYLDAPDEATLHDALEVVQTYVNSPGKQTLDAVVAQAALTAPPEMMPVSQDGTAYGPQLIMADDGRLHLLWWDSRDRSTGDIFHRRREPNGSWTPAESLTTDIPGYVSQYDATMRLRSDGAVCAFWVALSELNYYQRCQRDGIWEVAQPVFAATGIKREFQPAFAADGRLHFIYLDGAGSIFSAEQELLSGEADLALNPRFVVDVNGRLHAVWLRVDEQNGIDYRWSDDGGQSWAEVETVANVAFTPVINLQADATGGVHLIWSNEATLSYQRWQLATGWETAVAITTERGYARCDNIGFDLDDSGLAHAAWHTGSQGSELIYARQQADGTWTQPRLLSGESCRFARVPVLAVGRDNQTHLVWIPDNGEQNLHYAAFKYQR
jgi:hypothetical protein